MKPLVFDYNGITCTFDYDTSTMTLALNETTHSFKCFSSDKEGLKDAIIDELKSEFNYFLAEQEKLADEFISDPGYYEDYFCDVNWAHVDYHRPEVWREIEGDFDVKLTDALKDKIIRAAEIELGDMYCEWGDYVLESMAVYGSEYEYEVELADFVLIDLINCFDDRLELFDVNEEIIRDFTRYTVTPCLSISEEALAELLEGHEPGPNNGGPDGAPTPNERRSQFQCIPGGVAMSGYDRLKLRMQRGA